MAGENLIRHLRELILPQRLSMITSLEISWLLKTLPSDDFEKLVFDDENIDEDDLSTFLQAVSTEFPNLKRLYASLEDHDSCDFYYGGVERHISTIEKHLNRFILRMPGLEECAFSLPLFLFDFLYHEAALIEGKSGDQKMWTLVESHRQVWHSVEGKMTVMRLPYADSYPQPPFQLDDDKSSVGYWLLEGTNEPLEAEEVDFSDYAEINGYYY